MEWKSKALNSKENMLRAITFTGPEYVPYESKHYGKPVFHRFHYDGDTVPPGIGGRDRWGIEWAATEKSMVCFPRVHPLEDFARLDDFRFPDIGDFHLGLETGRHLRELDREDVLLEAVLPYGAFDRAWALAGMETLMVALLEDRERVKRLAKAVIDDHLQAVKFFLQETGPDLFLISDDLGAQRSLLMSPDVWREVFKPELRRLVGAIHDAGKLVDFHCCGHIMPLVEDFIEIGIDILNPIQVRANDPAELGGRYTGRIVFFGGVDTQYTLMRGTPEEVRREVRLRLRQLGGVGGGYILGPDQTMPFPAANLQAMFEEAMRYGRYPLKIPRED